MTLTEYQQRSERTLPATHHLSNYALGITGESGEVAELIKKHEFHGHELDKNKLAEELGDVLFYVAATATACGLSLEDIGAGNEQKLRKRYPKGFDKMLSKLRCEVDDQLG